MPHFQYGNSLIEYTLEHSPKKKEITISVEWIDGVKVIAPPEVDIDQIESVLYKKAPWIIKKWSGFEEISEPSQPKEFVSGEKFPYLGRQYRLKVGQSNRDTSPTLAFQNGRFLAGVPADTHADQRRELLYPLFKDWYLRNGRAKLKERLKLFAPKMGLTPTKLELKEQKMRWGSCTKEGAVYLNWRLLMAPMSIVDYVLVHEIAHILHADHSTEYWRFVRSILPDYEQRKEWLRIHGPTLIL